MKARTLLMAIALSAVGGCGYNESTPEGFYQAYVNAWANSDFDKVLSMHYVSEGKPNGMDYSHKHIEAEIKKWEAETGDKTPMAACRRTLNEMSGFNYSQDDEKIKVMYAVKGDPSTRENLDPLLTIIKVDDAWKVQDVTGSKTSQQSWVGH